MIKKKNINIKKSMQEIASNKTLTGNLELRDKSAKAPFIAKDLYDNAKNTYFDPKNRIELSL